MKFDRFSRNFKLLNAGTVIRVDNNMGSKQRSKYSSKGRFGKKPGRHSNFGQETKYAFKRKKNGSQHTIANNTNKYRISEINGFKMKICRDTIEGSDQVSQQVVTDRHLYSMKSTIDDGKNLVLKLQKKKISTVHGYRLIELINLSDYINDMCVHVAQCKSALGRIILGQRPYQLICETKRFGLASVLLGQCLGCLETLRLRTSSKIHLHNDLKHVYDVNARAVWGTMVTGGGCNALNEQASTLDMPGMTRHTFGKIENEVGHMWEDVAREEMLAAGVEEKKLALERGDFHEGIPAITVICDGGWSKRSHKHSYNALGGVGVIIGAATKKLLFMGIRNRNCYICTRAINNSKEPRNHDCFKNWSESSQAMEADIILEGFQAAERMHGVRYTRMIGDGDSSVYARLQENVPVWGSQIKKIECANHISKCLRTRLEQLVEDNPHYKGRNNLTKTRRVRIVSTVRSAILYRNQHQSTDFASNVKLLQADIMNSVQHAFGNHTNCSDFCSIKKKPPSASQKKDTVIDVDEDDNFLQNMVEYWSEGLTEKEQLEARSSDLEPVHTDIDQSLHCDIRSHLERVAGKADKLLANATTNLAEFWMGIRMKFDGGKVYNRCNRGSWGYRCYGALLRKNLGVNWAPITWERTTGTLAGRSFKEEYSGRNKHLQKTTIHQAQKQYKMRRWKRKMATFKSNLTKKAKLEYGPECLEVTPDISPEELEAKKVYFYEKEVNVSLTILEHIEQQTRQQSLSGYWVNERKKRLTASNFSQVIKRNPSIKVCKLIRRLLYSTFRGTRLTQKGLRMEKSAILEYIRMKTSEGDEVDVTSMGLYVDRDNPYLAASIDGLVSSKRHGKGIIEIKHVLLNKNLSLQEAANKLKSFCLTTSNGELRLKKAHPFFYQIQGQLNILNLSWADLLVRRVEPYQIHVERINRDESCWTDVMLPKLKAFYQKALLPELAVPRNNKKPGIREPGIWYSAPLDKKTRKRQKKQIPTPTYSDTVATPDRTCFLGKQILHEWLDEFGRGEWYTGLVVEVLSGEDGDEDAVYEVIYEGSDDKYELDHLGEDYTLGSVQFISDES